MLDATDPAIYTDGQQAFKLTWSGGKMGDAKPDVDAMIALFKAAKLEVPYLEPKPSAKAVNLTRWEAPDAPCGKPIGEPPEVTVHSGAVPEVWKQDRPRGGWTGYSTLDGEEVGTLTAGQALEKIPGFEDPRPCCVLKKAHSGDCLPPDGITALTP
jgi:hypothetical protein